MDRVVIVGGGTLGTMPAVAARLGGMDVVHMQREAGYRAASFTTARRSHPASSWSRDLVAGA
ncbi:MAG TPA: hypothetical protein VLM11_05515 [Streptosporangiaceae bacterium]|nr:hypothetical protein [Streptosporangiaceae bacterium]